MKHKQNIINLAVAAALCIAGTSSAYATNGYFAHGYGSTSKALGGGGSALPQDAMAAATNPAGMAWVGSRIDAGAAIFSPKREYSTTGGGFFAPHSEKSDSNYFLIPHFAYNRDLGNGSSVGVSVYGNGGMNTDYGTIPAQGNTGTFGGGGPNAPFGTTGKAKTGVNLIQLFVAPTYSQKFSDNASWGVSAILAHQRFEATGLNQFEGFTTTANASGFATAPNNLTDNGVDTSNGLGFKVGVQGDVSPKMTLAASYQSRVYMSKFDDYSDLFAEGGDFDIPQTLTLGLAYKPNDRMAFTADVQRIWFSDVDAIGNAGANLFNCPALGGADVQSCLGGKNGAGFGWDDMTILKLGFQWATSDAMTWRVGYSHSSQPIPDEEVMFNILAPAVVEKHITMGFTRKMSKTSDLTFAAMYAPSKSVNGVGMFGDPIELEMKQSEFELSYSWKF